MSKFGWSYPPGAASDPLAPYNQEEELSNWALEEAFIEFHGPYHLYQRTYKTLACGPTLGFLVGSPKIDPAIWYYGDGLRCLGSWADMARRGELVHAISVSSIVEGVDRCTSTYTLMLSGSPDSDPEYISQSFWKNVDACEKEAEHIWDETHGCEGCAAEHRRDQQLDLFLDLAAPRSEEYEGMDGNTPVHPRCPECHGQGAIL